MINRKHEYIFDKIIFIMIYEYLILDVSRSYVIDFDFSSKSDV